MLEQAVTNTKIIKSECLSAEALDKLIFYCGGEHAWLGSRLAPPEQDHREKNRAACLCASDASCVSLRSL